MNNKKKKKILIVEDEIIVAKDLAYTLEELGYEVLGHVSTAEQAIKECAEKNPDLVLMDIMLKGDKDGIHAAEEIRNKYSIPIVFLTAYSSENVLPRAKETKPYGYLIKPYDQINLYTTIEVALYKHSFERTLIDETENALATIIGTSELLMDECKQKNYDDCLNMVEKVKNTALLIKNTIEKL